MIDEDEEYTVEEHRYLFTVRQRFGEEPRLDCFYKIKVPNGISGDQARVMKTLKPDFCKEEIEADSAAMRGMSLRLRFNTDCYQGICMVRTTEELDGDELEMVVRQKHREGKLIQWLKDAEIGR